MPGFRVTAANRGDVIRLCQRLDGIPLAMEAAAVRLRALPLPELAKRLENRFQILNSGRRGAIPRHQAAALAIEWIVTLRSPAKQEMWARLSVFAGTFDARRCQEVCAGPARHASIDRGPSSAWSTSPSCCGRAADGTRYRLLGTLREFGAERLADGSSRTAVRGG